MVADADPVGVSVLMRRGTSRSEHRNNTIRMQQQRRMALWSVLGTRVNCRSKFVVKWNWFFRPSGTSSRLKLTLIRNYAFLYTIYRYARMRWHATCDAIAVVIYLNSAASAVVVCRKRFVRLDKGRAMDGWTELIGWKRIESGFSCQAHTHNVRVLFREVLRPKKLLALDP